MMSMTKNLPPALSSQQMFEQARKEATGRASTKVDLRAISQLDSYLDAAIGEEQFNYLATHMSGMQDLIAAATTALQKLSQTPQAIATLATLKTAIQAGENGPEAQASLLNLLQSPELREVSELGINLYGLQGIGLGVAGALDLLIPRWEGWAGGVDGNYIFEYKVGTTTIPAQFIPRIWSGRTKAIGALVSAGLSLTLWFKPPVDSKHLIGTLFSAVPVPVIGIAPFGVQVELFGWVPGTDEVTSNSSIHLSKFIFGWSINLEVGLNYSAGLIIGKQNVDKAWSLASLSIENTTTNSTLVVLNQECELDVTISWPRVGDTPTHTFSSSSESPTQITLSLPVWLSNAIQSGATQITPFTDWTWEINSDDDFVLTYTGQNDAAWQEDIAFTITGVQNNSGASAPQNGKASLKMTNVGNSSAFKVSFTVPSAVSLPLVQQAFTGSVEWQVKVDTTGFTVNWNGTSSSDTTLMGSLTATSSGDGFQYIYDDNGNPLSVTDANDVTYNLGYVFEQVDFQNDAYMQVAWWRDGSPYIAHNLFASQQSVVGDTAVIIYEYYEGSNAYPDCFQITATAKSVY